jgi:hypothetical protein
MLNKADQVTEMLNTFCDGVLGTIRPGSSYKNLINTLLIGVPSQWHNMCTFIDSLYLELTGVAGFNKDRAWKLVRWCVADLFSSLQPYAFPVGRIEDMGTIESKAACIWAMLQCHRVRMSFDLVKN